MSIQKEFVVRYRSDGHVRFQVPERACVAPISDVIAAGVAAIAGVYRGRLFSQQRKLSIRFDESVCSFQQLAVQMAAVLATLERVGGMAEKAASPAVSTKLLARVSDRVKNLKLSRWVKGRVVDVKETVQAAKIITQLSAKAPKSLLRNPEKIMIDFFNDIVVLYLIKAHWKRVIQLWLPNPLKYRYEWLTTLYLLYLLLRSLKAAQ
jgi:hypothetical protein